jgi:hypothetical protein
MTRHSADFVSLVFGLAFVAFGLVLLAGDTGALTLEWVAPITAIALGVLLVVAARSGGHAGPTPGTDPPSAGEPTPAEPSADDEPPSESEEA